MQATRVSTTICPGSLLTLALAGHQPVALGAGAGVAPRGVDAHLGGVALVGAGLTLVDVWGAEGRQGERPGTLPGSGCHEDELGVIYINGI